MSKNGSNKEYLFSLYSTMLNPKRLEEALKIKFDSIALEMWHGERRVDISGTDKSGRKILIDWCLKNFDKEHYTQIRDLISIVSKEEKSLIVAGATSFRNESYIGELIEGVVSKDINIELIFLEISEKIIPTLENINRLDCLEQIEQLNNFNCFDKYFKVVRGIKNYNSNKTISSKNIDSEYHYDYKKLLLADVLKRLRADSPHINLYKYKKLDRNSFTIGAGMGEVTYNIRCDKRNRLICEVSFSNSKGREVYYRLRKRKEDIDDYMDYMLAWNDSPCKVFTYINPLSYKDRDRMLKYFCRIVRKYIYGLHKFIIEEIKNITSI
ncbi:hypothetical protein [Clostridium sp. JS66]|uniref:hypothetical protein n=1 Tax=Clostridium sp. JS66 TaxID=3064705 RepID=UPI00298D74F9|nr:hypothetical protein [Clostridium sp. JS66]WPC42798.1 hypothetical protein Q6H37_04835 [Clostridium sp. JS66]